jgi:hypothetical protein
VESRHAGCQRSAALSMFQTTSGFNFVWMGPQTSSALCFRPPSDMNLAVLLLVRVADEQGGVGEPAVEGNYPEQYGPAR